MTFPQSVFSEFIRNQALLPDDDLYEVRLENDANGQPIYIGLTITPNAPTSQDIWALLKLTYDVNGFLLRKQLPDAGQGFNYNWDNRATFFT